MKALSLRQPWALAVVHYGKTIENRRWNTSFRGEFLIHAAKGMTGAEYDDAEDFIADVLGFGVADRAAFAEDFNKRGLRGGIVGRARLVEVIPPCSKERASLFATECTHKWHMPEQFGFVLADVRPLPFVPCAGSLGFFGVPARVLEQLGIAASEVRP